MKIGVIGLGAMGSAMAKIILEKDELAIYSRSPEKVADFVKEHGGKLCKSLEELADFSEAIIVAVKPKQLDLVAEDLDPLIKKETLILSILGGVTIETLQDRFSNGIPFRVMPNLPLLCKKGMIGIADEKGIDSKHKKVVEKILSNMGTVTWIEEGLMNGFASLTGSNPALIYVLIEAMVDAGIRLGFKADVSLDYVLKTIEGSVKLVQESGKSPQELRYQVCSPGGTSIVGVEALEEEGVRYGVMEALRKIALAAEKDHS